MIQNKTITRLFDNYIKETNSTRELNLLVNSFNNDENEKLLRRLIRNELNSGFETVEINPGNANLLAKSYRQIKKRTA